VANTAWQQRIRRAEKLAAQYSFATEILSFYGQVARFQQDLYQRIERDGGGVEPRSAGARPAVEWASRPLTGQREAEVTKLRFFEIVEKQGPERLAQVARELRAAPASAWSDLLDKVWAATGAPPSNPEEFLAFAFLQPYAEFVRSRFRLQLEGYAHSLCPFCNRKPALGVLRQQGDGGRRSLVCGFCLTEWEFRRVICPGCGQEDNAKLPVYTAETFPHIRVECCDTCQSYIKSIDLTKNGLAEPLIDELASVPLNLWAQEHGYAKLYPNLLGM
jgi:FdhE protein